MKLDHVDKSKRFTKLLLNDFSTALLELVQEKKLESITVAEIMAQHYGNTVQMVLSACFRDKSIAKKEAVAYLDFLLGTLEKASERE